MQYHLSYEVSEPILAETQYRARCIPVLQLPRPRKSDSQEELGVASSAGP